MTVLTFGLLLSFLILTTHSLTPTRLRVEYQEDPVGIDVTTPRFYWAVSFDNNQASYSQRGDSQSAYEITIYDVDNSSNLVIDTGKVSSNQSTHVIIDGFTPLSHNDYKWCVSIWNSSDIMQDTSSCGTFSMGLLNGDSDWQDAVWLGINDDTNSVNHYFTNEFRLVFDLTGDEILDIKKARIYIATPNYYKAWLNEEELSQEHELGHFTTFEESCYYDVIDCTSYLTKTAINAKNSKNVKNSKNKNSENENNSQKNVKNSKNNNGASTVSNAFGLMLGQGWYSQSSINIGVPMFKVLIYITFNNDTLSPKTFTTDVANWYTHEGPVRMSDIYIGEHYDTNYETPGWTSADYDFYSTDWVLATPVADPTIGTLYSSAIMAKIEKVEAFSPVTITQPLDGVFVVDFGQNVAGFTRITIPGNMNKGSNVTMIHSEQLYPNGTVQELYSNSPMIATYTLRGDGETEVYEPLFTYFGYQYVQITGFPGVLTINDIVSYFIHSNFDTNSDISFGPSSVEDPSSNAQLLNRIQRMTRYASLSNWMNIPTDCPQRERRGWLGDAQLTAEVTMYNFDMPASYTKFLRDIRDAQVFGNKSGAIPDCAPYYGHGALPGDPSWTPALIFITHWMYKYYGDTRIIEENYDNMCNQISFLDTQMNSTGLLPVSVSYYGDWCAANPDGNDAAHKSTIINTYQYAKQALYLSQMANVLGKTNDSEYYFDKVVNSQKALLKYYFDSSNGYFIDGASNAPVATLQSLCLDLNVLNLTNNSDADITTTVAAMVDDVVVTNKNHLAAGIIGVKYILRELCKTKHCDVALNANVLTDFPSFGYWDSNGATTLWENWQTTQYEAAGSKNHIMFGGQGVWYYQHLAGIRLLEDEQDTSINTVGWKKFLIDPYYNVTDFGIYIVNALVDTIVGDVTVDLNVKQTPVTQSNGDVLYMTLEVNVPVNAECMVYISRLATFGSDYVPMSNWVVNESGNTVWQNSAFVDNGSKGVVSGNVKDDDTIEFEVQSGLYSFELLVAAA